MSEIHESQDDAEESKWLRLLLVIAFALIFQVGEVVFGAVTLFQIVCMLLTGGRNERLNEFSETLTAYLYDVLQYVCLQSDARPWPLSDQGTAEKPAA